jgi:hypothetical protein
MAARLGGGTQPGEQFPEVGWQGSLEMHDSAIGRVLERQSVGMKRLA